MVKKAIDNWVEGSGLQEEEARKKLFSRENKVGKSGVWNSIAAWVPGRPADSVYRHALRLYAGNKRGRWKKGEEQELRELVEKYGPDWKSISKELNRGRMQCRDKWRILRKDVFKRRVGKWGKDEDKLLVKALKYEVKDRSKLGNQQSNLPWTAVSEHVPSRTRDQCRTRWYNTLQYAWVNKQIRKKKKKNPNLTIDPMWTSNWIPKDDELLLKAILDSGAEEADEIEFGRLLKTQGFHRCKMRWRQLYRRIPDSKKEEEFEDNVQWMLDNLVELQTDDEEESSSDDSD